MEGRLQLPGRWRERPPLVELDLRLLASPERGEKLQKLPRLLTPRLLKLGPGRAEHGPVRLSGCDGGQTYCDPGYCDCGACRGCGGLTRGCGGLTHELCDGCEISHVPLPQNLPHKIKWQGVSPLP